MAYKIEKRIIPGLVQRSLRSSRFVVAHESGNPNNTGTNSLENEIKYMTNNWRNAFTSHWVGSGGRIVQLAHVGKYQYGAGGKANPYSYAHVELARTNNKATFEKDYAAYVWLLRKLADDAGIPKTLDTGNGLNDRGIKSHDWIRRYLGGTTHTDPYAYLASFGVSKAQFKRDIESGIKTAAIKEDELTMSQYTELKNEINKLKKLIEGDKSSAPSNWAKPIWNEKVKEGYFDGTRPKDDITRQEVAVIIERLSNNIKEFQVDPVEERVEKLENK